MTDPQENLVPEQKPVHSTADVVFAWLCLLFGYLFCRTLPVTENPLGGFLLVLLLYGTAAVILILKKVRLTGTFLAAGISAVVISVSLILTESAFILHLAYTYAIASYFYFLYAAFGNRLETGCSDYIFIDYFQALFLFPFRSLLRIFPALFQGKGKPILILVGKVFCGILIAAIPTAVVLGLLCYDESFRTLLEDIFSADTQEISSHMMSALWGIPVAMVLFGLFFSASRKTVTARTDAAGAQAGIEKLRAIPKLTVVSAVVPILFLYVVFFVSQWKYYISGFTGDLPEGFSYAEYAREGFFQLCAVSAINLILLVAITLFTRRGSEKPSAVIRILSCVFCLFTLILISTAVAKLVMYISTYGLTHKRIYAMWLMAVIAIVYLVITVGQFVKGLKTVFVSLAVCVVMFAGLSMCNVSRVTADYNIGRYLDGTLETVDMELMEELGNSAIPALAELAEEIKTDPKQHDAALCMKLVGILKNKATTFQEQEFAIFSFNFPAYQAEAALRDSGYME